MTAGCLRKVFPLVLLVSSTAMAAVNTPSVVYPSNGSTDIWVNPFIFWSAMTESPSCTGSGCVQRDVQVQISTSSSFGSNDIVWENWNCNGTSGIGCAYGGGFSIAVDRDHGDFKNALAGRNSLDNATTYFVRIRQQTRSNLSWSSFSSGTHSFRTRAVYGNTTWYVRPDGSNTNCTGRTNAAYPGSGTGQSCAFATIGRAHSAASTGDAIFVGDGNYSENINVTKGVRIFGQSRNGTVWRTNGNIRWMASNSWLDNLTLRGNDCSVNQSGGGGLQVENDRVVVTNIRFDCGAIFGSLSSAAPLTGNVYRDIDLKGNADGTMTCVQCGEAFTHGYHEYLGVLRMNTRGFRNCMAKYNASNGPYNYVHYEDLYCSDNFNHASEFRGSDYLTIIRNRNANNAMEFGEGITMPANDQDTRDCAQYVSVEFSSGDDGMSFSDGICTNTGAGSDLTYLNLVNNAIDGSGDDRGPALSAEDPGNTDRITPNTRFYINHNIWYREGTSTSIVIVWDGFDYRKTNWSEWRADCDCDAGSFITDPDFVEPQGLGLVNYDHTPRAGSPCIDNGDPAYDIRYQEAAAGITDGGLRVDIGSVEVAAGGGGGGTPPAAPANAHRIDIK